MVDFDIGPRMAVVGPLLQVERVVLVGLSRWASNQPIEHGRIAFDTRTDFLETIWKWNKQKLDDRQNKSARNTNTTKKKKKERNKQKEDNRDSFQPHKSSRTLHRRLLVHWRGHTHNTLSGFVFVWDTLLVTDTLSFDCWNYTTDISRCQFGVRFLVCLANETTDFVIFLLFFQFMSWFNFHMWQTRTIQLVFCVS